MELIWEYLGRKTYLLLLLVLFVIQESHVDAVRGGHGRSFRRSSYNIHHDSYHSTSHSHASAGAVAGAIIGGIGAVIIIVGILILVCICCKKSRSRQGQVIQDNGVSPPPYSAAPVYYVSYDNKGMEMGEKPLEFIPTPPSYDEINQTTASPPAYEPSK